ncbi:MAG: M16 family metallopeptidase [Woeseiaceae bacterium]
MSRINKPLRLVVLLFALVTGTALAQGVTLPEVGRIELDNGVVLILHEKEDVPLIGLEAIILGGAVSDPDGFEGTANLLAGLLEKGAGERNAAEFAEAVDSVGGELSASASTESISISAEFMARDVDLMVELLADMLRRPKLDDDEVRKLRDRSIAEFGAAKDGNVRGLTPIYGNAFLFGAHPFGRSLAGSEESLARITAADVRDYYENHFGGNRLIIAVAGDFEASAMAGKLNAAFADWGPVDGALPEPEVPELGAGRRVLLVDKPGTAQSYFWIGNVGVGLNYDSRAELDIANTLFGGRFTSMLMDELRTKAGLTYGASSSLRRHSIGGSVAMISYTKTDTTVEAIDLAVSLLEKLREEGVADDMIESGKNYILGQYTPRFETAAQLAGQFAGLESYGLDESYVNDYGAAVAAADGETIRSVINGVYPATDDLVFAIIGDAEKIREQVAKYGPVTEMSITDPRFTPE